MHAQIRGTGFPIVAVGTILILASSCLYRPGFINGSPTKVEGFLTLHGITKPVVLRIDSFKCVVDLPATQKHVCGADAVGTFNRADFGITIGQRFGFKMQVTLHIQVEAFRVE
jgi:polyisoprenoid-binding protein YceI